MKKASLLVMTMAMVMAGCGKRVNWAEREIPGNTLVLEFSRKIKFVMDIHIDGKEIPIDYAGGSHALVVTGLTPGTHHFNIHSISYVFGPEFERFKVDDQGGAYQFIQTRKYRSAIPKARSQVSFRAYRKSLKGENKFDDLKIKARFE